MARGGRTYPGRVDRRLVGLVVLVLAVVAALAGNGRTKELAGTPEPGPIPGPPRVGDCVLEPFGWNGVDEASLNPTYLSPAVGPCEAERHGEVVAILPDGLDYQPTGGPGAGGVPGPDDQGVDYQPDPNEPYSRCIEFVEAFYGTKLDQPARPSRSAWAPSITVGLDIVGPSPMQIAAGQRWLACAAVGYAFNGPAPYRGTLEGVMSSMQVPAELAACLVTVPQPDGGGGARGECTRPHDAEQFASVWSGDQRLDPAELRATCVDLVATMTAMPDPTAAGRLELQVVESRVMSVQLSPGSDELIDVLEYTYACLLVATGDRELAGPLLGLGSGPVPLN